MALCLEPLDPAGSSLTRCVALAGRQPGLRISPRGEVQWLDGGEESLELWVTADARLSLWRNSGAPAVTLHRARRTLDVPPDRPVIVLDGDEIHGPGFSFRIHVHGETESVAAPELLPLPRRPRRFLRATAAAMAVAALGSQSSATEPQALQRAGGDAGVEAATEAEDAGEDADGGALPIEVRDHPPAPPPVVHGGCCGTKPGYDTAFNK